MDNGTKNRKSKITAKVISLSDGYVYFEDIKVITVKSKKYNIMIMEDYLPVIGEVIGDVTLLGKDYKKEFLQIKGFYVHKNNEFERLIKGKNNVG